MQQGDLGVQRSGPCRGMEEGLAPYLTATPRLVPGFAALVHHEAPPEGAEPLTQDG